MRNLKYAAAAFTALIFCAFASGCSDSSVTEAEYHVISDGVIIDPVDAALSENKEKIHSDFYIPEGMETDYYRKNVLNPDEIEIYNDAVENLARLKTKTPLPVDSAVYQKILDIIRLEQLSFCHVIDRSLDYNGERQEFDVLFTYRLTADELSSMNMASEKAAKDIIAQLTPDMDDYEKLKFFHDYLILNCEIDSSDEYADTVYGTLVRKKALCEGYTKAFSYLCNLAGIENTIVTGQTTVPHMWNMVKLNGSWYHVDVTWDNPSDRLHEEYPGVILYQYFMVTDSVIRNNHEIWNYPAEPPNAYGTEENYFVREGADITSDGELLTVAENAITDAVKCRKNSAMIKFATTDLYLSSLADIDDDEFFDYVKERVKTECNENISLLWTDYYGQYRIITFIIDYGASDSQ